MANPRSPSVRSGSCQASDGPPQGGLRPLGGQRVHDVTSVGAHGPLLGGTRHSLCITVMLMRRLRGSLGSLGLKGAVSATPSILAKRLVSMPVRSSDLRVSSARSADSDQLLRPSLLANCRLSVWPRTASLLSMPLSDL